MYCFSLNSKYICKKEGGHARISEEWLGAGALTPFKNHKAIGFCSKTVSNPLRNHKAITVVLSIAHLRIKNKNKKHFHSWTPSEIAFWIRHWGLHISIK